MTNLKPSLLASSLLLAGSLHSRSTFAITTLTYDIVNITNDEIIFNNQILASDEGTTQSQRSRQGFRMEIGTPPQNVWLSPTLLLDDIIVRNESSCLGTNVDLKQQIDYQGAQICEWIAQGLYRSQRSSTFNDQDDSLQIPPWRYMNDDEGDPDDGPSVRGLEGDILSGTEFTENIRFPNATSELSQDRFDDLALHQGERRYLVQYPNFLGLGRQSKFLEHFFPNNRMFGVSFMDPREYIRMVIDFDGIDESKRTGEVYTTSMPPLSEDEADDDENDATYPFRAEIESIDIDGQQLLDGPMNFKIDISHIPGTKFPRDVFYRFSNITGAYYDKLYPGVAFATYNTSIPESFADQWNLTVRFSNGYVTTIPQSYLTQNLVYSEDSTFEEGERPESLSLITMAEISDTYAPGRILPGAVLAYDMLMFSYFAVDYERNEWSIARSATADQVLGSSGGGGNSNTDDNDDNEDDNPNSANGRRVDIHFLLCMTALTSFAATIFMAFV